MEIQTVTYSSTLSDQQWNYYLFPGLQGKMEEFCQINCLDLATPAIFLAPWLLTLELQNICFFSNKSELIH